MPGVLLDFLLFHANCSLFKIRNQQAPQQLLLSHVLYGARAQVAFFFGRCFQHTVISAFKTILGIILVSSAPEQCDRNGALFFISHFKSS